MAVNFLRAAARPSNSLFRPAIRIAPRAARVAPQTSFPCARLQFSTSAVQRSSEHGEETFEEFSQRYEQEFDRVQDVFELQRNLNNAFAYDLVPSPSVITAALKAARRVNDYPTAVRIFEGIKAKVENSHQYEEYVAELEPIREELGINLKEELYPEGTDSPFYNP